MSFSDQWRSVAVLPARREELFPVLFGEHAELAADLEREIPTILSHWDDEAHTQKRAASVTDGTVQPVLLTDGRECWCGLWQSDLEARFLAGEIEGVEELTPEEFEALRPARKFL